MGPYNSKDVCHTHSLEENMCFMRNDVLSGFAHRVHELLQQNPFTYWCAYFHAFNFLKRQFTTISPYLLYDCCLTQVCFWPAIWILSKPPEVFSLGYQLCGSLLTQSSVSFGPEYLPSLVIQNKATRPFHSRCECQVRTHVVYLSHRRLKCLLKVAKPGDH